MHTRIKALLALGLTVAVLAPSVLHPHQAQAEALSAGSLVKSPSSTAVYYYSQNGKRYVFPDEGTYYDWYTDFSNVETITEEALASLPIGRNVTRRPGLLLLRAETAPNEFYAITKGGTLRRIVDQTVAGELYGEEDWGARLANLDDALFASYKLGPDIVSAADYDVAAELYGSPTIDVAMNAAPRFATTTNATTGLTVSQLLAACPSETEITQINRELRFTFSRSILDDKTFWNGNCVPGATNPGPIDVIYNVFRALRQTDFATPIPLLDATNAYQWLRGFDQIHFTYGDDDVSSTDRRLVINVGRLPFEKMQIWSPQARDISLASFAGLLLHEGWHAKHDAPHDCTTKDGSDTSLESGGAWAAVYWYNRWLAEQSGPYLSQAEKDYARMTAADMATDGTFCAVSPDLEAWADQNRFEFPTLPSTEDAS